ncbi:LysM peptidoglycan-binding domain-containing protein [Georgenia daeguensis]|uniref:LysM domain-containing protein n=1 Tax=Georgenia daeguensis TaxID=908355 RepID=A0ABP8ES25_9MICO
MSALVAQPAWSAPARPARRRVGTRPAGRGSLQLVGPGFVPPVVAPAAPVRPVVSRPPREEAPGLRLTARGRRVLTTLALLAATGASVGLGALVGTAANPASSSATTTVTVAPGQTLWSLASATAAPGEDPRDVLAEITELNGLASSELAVGQELLVPVD